MDDKTTDADHIMAGWQETIREVEANKDGFVEIPRKRIVTTPTQAMNDKTLALLNEVTNSLADDIEGFSCGELRQALYRAIAQREEAAERIEALEAALNTPEIHDWAKGAALEAAHQRERWGVEHDAGKTPFDWFWLIGYLAQKAADAAVRGDTEKAMHHTISTGAALANWHLALSGVDNSMRPGIVPPKALEGSGND